MRARTRMSASARSAEIFTSSMLIGSPNSSLLKSPFRNESNAAPFCAQLPRHNREDAGEDSHKPAACARVCPYLRSATEQSLCLLTRVAARIL